MRILTLSAIVWFVATSTVIAAGNEALCTTMGADCVASEPLNTNSWTKVADYQFNPDDTTSGDKQARAEGGFGTAYTTSHANFDMTVDTVSTNSTMFAALPAGASVTYIPRGPQDGAIASQFQTRFRSGTDPFTRQGMRFYRYYSSDYSFTIDAGHAGCNSAKVTQLGTAGNTNGGPITQEGYGWALYDFSTSTGWSASVDCCGPPYPMPGGGIPPDSSSMKGKWIRYEIYISNNTTSGSTAFEWYMKNITDNLPEVTLIDTHGSALFTGVHPSSAFIDMGSNNFRSDNTDPCTGYAAHTHFLWAAWSSDAGQRIAAASEVEGGDGGSGGTRRFSPQFNLRRVELPPTHIVHVSDVRKEDEELN